MNEVEIIKRLAAAAEGQGPPEVHVAGRVLARIAAMRQANEGLVFGVFAAAAVAAAVGVCGLAVTGWAGGGDGLSDFVNPIASVLP